LVVLGVLTDVSILTPLCVESQTNCLKCHLKMNWQDS